MLVVPLQPILLVVMGIIAVSNDMCWVLLVGALNPNGICPKHTTKNNSVVV